jgi:hypothetical protein
LFHTLPVSVMQVSDLRQIQIPELLQ